MATLRGYLDQYGKPLLTLDLVINGEYLTETFRIDTGFDDYIAIPKDVIEKYQVEYIGKRRLRLPTGVREEFDLINVEIILHNFRLKKEAIIIKVRPGLIGMALLKEMARIIMIDFDDYEIKLWLK